MTTNVSVVSNVIANLDEWVNKLATPLLSPIQNPDTDRLELREHRPDTVMIGKCVRAVSGIHAALALADRGYVAECGAMLRMVSDFCTEIMSVGMALQSETELSKKVNDFVEQYFVPRARTLDEFKKRGTTHYPTRKDLMKGEFRLAQAAGVDAESMREHHEFLNHFFDGYVHGAYETTMELYDPSINGFRMRGQLPVSQQYRHGVFFKVHEVVQALVMTAAVTGHREVFEATRDAMIRISPSTSLAPSH